MNQPEFWITVEEDSVYPDLEEDVTDTLFSGYTDFTDLTEEVATIRESRSTRFYARKVIDVKFAETSGSQKLQYTETDKYEHVYILDIRHQPLEGDLLACMRINSKLYAFGTSERGYGGTYVPPATFRGQLKISDSYIYNNDGDLYGRVIGRYFPSIYGSQPASLKFVMTSGPSSIAGTTVAVPLGDYYLLLDFDTGFQLGDDLGNGYRFDVYGVLGATEEIISESLIVDIPSTSGPFGVRPYSPPAI